MLYFDYVQTDLTKSSKIHIHRIVKTKRRPIIGLMIKTTECIKVLNFQKNLRKIRGNLKSNDSKKLLFD